MREDVYRATKAFNGTAEARGLKGEQARYLRFAMRDARRSGLELPKGKRDELGGLLKRIAKIRWVGAWRGLGGCLGGGGGVMEMMGGL